MRTLNILYQTNENYAAITGVSMTSLFENNKHIEEINIFILDDEISNENKVKYIKLCEKYGRKIQFEDTKIILNRLKELKVAPFKNTYTTYFKLFAIDKIELNNDRILQLDGDTIIDGSLDELCDMDISNVICAATYDCTMNKYKKLIGIPETDKYYNGGVLLVNQRMWRRERCEARIIEHLRSVRHGYYTVDQDIINVLFRHKIKYMPITFNYNSGFYIYGIKESLKIYNLKNEYYTDINEIVSAFDKPRIYHCMGAMTGRPWEADSIHLQNGIFDSYLSLSPWKDYKKNKVNRNAIFKIQKKLYLVLPRRFYIPIHKLAQAWYLAKMNRLVQKEK